MLYCLLLITLAAGAIIRAPIQEIRPFKIPQRTMRTISARPHGPPKLPQFPKRPTKAPARKPCRACPPLPICSSSSSSSSSSSRSISSSSLSWSPSSELSSESCKKDRCGERQLKQAALRLTKQYQLFLAGGRIGDAILLGRSSAIVKIANEDCRTWRTITFEEFLRERATMSGKGVWWVDGKPATATRLISGSIVVSFVEVITATPSVDGVIEQVNRVDLTWTVDPYWAGKFPGKQYCNLRLTSITSQTFRCAN